MKHRLFIITTCLLFSVCSYALPTNVVTPNVAIVDFTLANIMEDNLYTANFDLLNNTTSPWIINRIHTSCGCTSAIAVDKKSGKQLFQVVPGQETAIRVSIDPKDIGDEPFSKGIAVYVNGKDEPVARYELKGQFVPRKPFGCERLDFGVIGPQTLVTIPVTLRLYGEFAPQSETAPVIKSSNPIIAIASVSKAGERNSEDITNPEEHLSYRCKRYEYKVTIDPRKVMGTIQDTLSFTEKVQGKSYTISLPVYARIAGDYTVIPNIIGLGIFNKCDVKTWQTAITGADIKHCRITTSDKNLKAAMIPDTNQSQLGTISLSVSEKISTGPIDAKVYVQTPDGKTLIVPIHGMVK